MPWPTIPLRKSDRLTPRTHADRVTRAFAQLLRTARSARATAPQQVHDIDSNQRQTLADILSAYVGHNALGIDELAADLHRFVFLLGLSDGEQLFGEPTP
jgi:hypothetical protein